jgi:hypothetical protein
MVVKLGVRPRGDGDNPTSLLFPSTPYGKRGFFYECWEHDADEDWFRITVPATECGRISKEFLEEERRAIGPQWFAQEYMAEFVDNGAAVFGRDLVAAAVDDGFGPLDL